MLKKFSVTNFKNYKKRIDFHLDIPANYEFNSNVIHDGIVTKSIIYGINGSGKSNLCLALFDIIFNLTDKEKMFNRYTYYLNYDSKKSTADFEYEFVFDGIPVAYKYSKSDVTTFVMESLTINGDEVISYNFITNEGYVSLCGAESLNIVSTENNSNKISRIKFVKNNAILEDNDVNGAFKKFCEFVDNMLMFYSLDERGYQGLSVGTEGITQRIIKENKVEEFSAFLSKNQLNYDLVITDNVSGKEIYCKTQRGLVRFWDIVSTGTKSLTLFYYWLLQIGKASLIVIDEYDAFYHFELAEELVRILREYTNVQIIFTTHNTDLLSNDLLRPDAYFIVHDNKIKPLYECTEKDIRFAHNLQKMYKAGAFRW